MPEQPPVPLPFKVEFDAAKREVVVSMTYGAPPQKTTRRKAIDSLEALVIAVAEHRHEAFLQTRLAQTLAETAITHLGADPTRLNDAVRALSDPTNTTPLGTLLYGPPPPGPAATGP